MYQLKIIHSYVLILYNPDWSKKIWFPKIWHCILRIRDLAFVPFYSPMFFEKKNTLHDEC